ncbi:class I SAM-dependent methyltransferase [candidate division KSB1 bacterium]|nr:class I SAM-dependent methyltransferase [candidate division KSB1 bacterium]
MDSFKDFYNQVGANYPEEDVVYKTIRGRIRRQFILNILNGWKGSFLEIGCNLGMYLRLYQGTPKFGMDISMGVLNRLRQSEPNLPIVQSDAQNNCFRSASFNRILCSEVLEHLYSPEKAVSEISRLLKPGGIALITTPNYRGERPGWTSLGALSDYGVEAVKDGLYYHTAFRSEELAEMGRKVGLELVESGTLEHEVKIASRPALPFFLTLRWINARTFQNSRIEKFNQSVFNRIQVLNYNIFKTLGLMKPLVRLISEGVRAYCILRKPIA